MKKRITKIRLRDFRRNLSVLFKKAWSLRNVLYYVKKIVSVCNLIIVQGVASFLVAKLERSIKNQLYYHEDCHLLWSLRNVLEHYQAYLMRADKEEEIDEQEKVSVDQVRDLVLELQDIIDEFMILKEQNYGNSAGGSLRKFSSCLWNLRTRSAVIANLKKIYRRTRDVKPKIRTNKYLRDEDEDAVHVNESDLVGINEPKQKLIELLVNGETNQQVVGVTGMPGIGKSTLTKQVYDDDRVKNYFPIRLWITVSQNFKKIKVLEDMIQQLRDEGVQVPKGQLGKRQEQVREFLDKNRYLIVFDDIWRFNHWDSIRSVLPENNCGSRVVVTSRHASVVNYASRQVYTMGPLSDEQSWILFCNKTFKTNTCPSLLEDICRKIVRKCGGLPLAVVTISGALAGKDQTRSGEWEMILRGLGAEIEENEAFQKILKVISVSFLDLPHCLKQCYMYLSFFPEDYSISRTKLLRFWVAERFAKSKEGKEAEEVADEYFRELVSRNLLQVTETTSDGRIKCCRLHDFIREVVKFISRRKNFGEIARAGSQSYSRRISRLSLHNLDGCELPEISENSKLRFLMISGGETVMGKALSSYDLTLLTTLDLQGLPLETFPVEVKGLSILRYLGLKRTKVKAVPSWVGSLQSLETLNLKHTFVTELPKEIFNLVNLRNLILYRYEDESFAFFNSKHGFKVSNGIGGLRNLQKLGFIELNPELKQFMEELSQLTRLTRLGVMKVRKEDGKSLCRCLKNMPNLCALSLLSEEEKGILDINEPDFHPPNLVRLYLAGQLEILPRWIPNLQGLVRLHLKWSRLQEDPLDLIQCLPNLVQLEMLQAYETDKLVFGEEGFLKLKHLCIDDFVDLRSIEVKKGAMPELRKMYILRCKSLGTVPMGIENLKKLKELRLDDMSEQLFNSINRDYEGGDFDRVAGIPDVDCVFREDGKVKVFPLHRHQVVPDRKFQNSLK